MCTLQAEPTSVNKVPGLHHGQGIAIAVEAEMLLAPADIAE